MAMLLCTKRLQEQRCNHRNKKLAAAKKKNEMSAWSWRVLSVEEECNKSVGDWNGNYLSTAIACVSEEKQVSVACLEQR